MERTASALLNALHSSLHSRILRNGLHCPPPTTRALQNSLQTCTNSKTRALRCGGLLSFTKARVNVSFAKATSKDKQSESLSEEWGDSDGESQPWDYKSYQALLQGGEEIVSIMESMIEVLGDVTHLDKESEDTAIQMAALACVGQRLEQLDGGYMLALDLMIAQAAKDKDDKRKQLLEVIKETTLAQLTDKSSPVVQIVSMLCHAPEKEHRRQILRSAAAGGGIHPAEGGGKITVPRGNLLDIANQANDLINGMEDKPRLPDRKLLAKLVLIREEAHDMLGGGILDVRNKPVLTNLPEPEVKFISKIIAIRPGPVVREVLENVMRGKDEGADIDIPESPENNEKRKARLVLPVRPGMFLETLTKLITGMYNNRTAAGITLQHLDWTYKNTMEILQEIGHGKTFGKNDKMPKQAAKQKEKPS